MDGLCCMGVHYSNLSLCSGGPIDTGLHRAEYYNYFNLLFRINSQVFFYLWVDYTTLLAQQLAAWASGLALKVKPMDKM